MSNYHVVKKDGGWVPRKEGASRASAAPTTQSKAEQTAKNLAHNSGGGEVRIHGRDGKIRDSDTVAPAKDPIPPRDQVH